MSKMRVSREDEERMSRGRRLLLKAFNVAYGSYIEQEAKKKAQWFDESFGQLYGHAKHEFKEIRDSKSKTVQIHNTIDCSMLNLMLLAKLLESEEPLEDACPRKPQYISENDQY